MPPTCTGPEAVLKVTNSSCMSPTGRGQKHHIWLLWSYLDRRTFGFTSFVASFNTDSSLSWSFLQRIWSFWSSAIWQQQHCAPSTSRLPSLAFLQGWPAKCWHMLWQGIKVLKLIGKHFVCSQFKFPALHRLFVGQPWILYLLQASLEQSAFFSLCFTVTLFSRCGMKTLPSWVEVFSRQILTLQRQYFDREICSAVLHYDFESVSHLLLL